MSESLLDVIRRARTGDHEANQTAFRMIENEIRLRIRYFLSRGSRDVLVDTTGVLDAMYIRMLDDPAATWQDRNEFMAHASRIIQNLLINLHRRRKAKKRGGRWQRVPMDSRKLLYRDTNCVDHENLKHALERLADVNPEAAKIVELKYYGQQSVADIAATLQTNPSAIYRKLRFATAWLRREIHVD